MSPGDPPTPLELRSRPYGGDADAARILRFLQDGWRVTGTAGGLFHIADFVWQCFMFTRDVFRPEERIRLTERPDGSLAGFAWVYPKRGEVALQIDPRLRGTAERWVIADDMLAWARERLLASGEAPPGGLLVAELESDAEFATFAAERGFARTDDVPMRFHRRSLSEPIPAPSLPAGLTVRPVMGEDEFEQRVAIHREVWHPSRFTIDGYRQLRATPWYDPDLDLVAVTPDGTFAAYATAWRDEVNRSGQFEPVGAREAFRGRGLARAVLLEGMRRLRDRRCDVAYVCTGEDRPPACRLYLSAGFEIADRWVYYRRGGGS